MMMLGITGVIGGFSVLLLPETSNQGLADTLEAIEEDSRYKISYIIINKEKKNPIASNIRSNLLKNIY